MLADEHSSTMDIDAYCNEIERTALWAGDMEITALSRALNVSVEIYSDQSLLPLVIHPNMTDGGNGINGVVRVAYYRHLYGLGQHYNALHRI